MFFRRFWYHGLYRGGGSFKRSLIFFICGALTVSAACWWLGFPSELRSVRSSADSGTGATAASPGAANPGKTGTTPLEGKAEGKDKAQKKSAARNSSAKDDLPDLHPGLSSEKVTEAAQSISIIISVCAIGFAFFILAWYWFYEPSASQTTFAPTKVLRKKGLTFSPRSSEDSGRVRYVIENEDS